MLVLGYILATAIAVLTLTLATLASQRDDRRVERIRELEAEIFRLRWPEGVN